MCSFSCCSATDQHFLTTVYVTYIYEYATFLQYIGSSTAINIILCATKKCATIILILGQLNNCKSKSQWRMTLAKSASFTRVRDAWLLIIDVFNVWLMITRSLLTFHCFSCCFFCCFCCWLKQFIQQTAWARMQMDIAGIILKASESIDANLRAYQLYWFKKSQNILISSTKIPTEKIDKLFHYCVLVPGRQPAISCLSGLALSFTVSTR